MGRPKGIEKKWIFWDYTLDQRMIICEKTLNFLIFLNNLFKTRATGKLMKPLNSFISFLSNGFIGFPVARIFKQFV